MKEKVRESILAVASELDRMGSQLDIAKLNGSYELSIKLDNIPIGEILRSRSARLRHAIELEETT